MKASLVLLVCFLLSVALAAQPQYFLGAQGDSCAETCMNHGLNCNPNINTNNSADIFQKLGVSCTADLTPWWATNQPGYVSESSDPNYGKCLGFIGVPGGVFCGGAFPSVQRVCRCDEPTTDDTTFGFGWSNGIITADEQYVFQHFVAPGDVGVMTHFWFTVGNPVGNDVVIAYYVDGEATPSIEFTPSLACGVGFSDTQAPWGNQWFGKGANDNSYFINYRIPFQKSIAVTARASGTYGGFYMIVRGATNLNLQFGGITMPPTARLNLYKVAATYQPLDWITLADIGNGTSGMIIMHTLAVQSQNLNFLEGCYHTYYPGQDFPGTLISTGAEDYFDSGWYFNAGQFHLPTAGFTHYSTAGGIQLSAYRVHEMDPLRFNNGFRFVWRNGDSTDASGIKCMMEIGGNTVGSPSSSYVVSYVWAYTW